MTQAAKLIDDLKNYMHDAREMCNRGEFIALEGLDSRVQDLCKAIEALPVPEAMQHAEQMDALMQELSDLQQHFIGKRAELGEELAGTIRHSKAAKAYATSDLSAPKEE